jgi:hypothetical protein
MSDKQTVEVITQSVNRLARDLATKKLQLKMAKENRDDFLESQKDFSPIDREYKKQKTNRDLFKAKLEQSNEKYKTFVEKVKDASLEVRELENVISQQLVEYALQKGESVIPSTSGEKVNFTVKCLFSAKQLKLFE